MSHRIQFFALLLWCINVGLAQHRNSVTGGIQTVVIPNAQVNHNYTQTVNSTVEYLFEFKNFGAHSDRPARVTVECLDATRNLPVLVVLRQAKGVLSWQVPLVVVANDDKFEYHRTSRTLCPNSNYQYNKFNAPFHGNVSSASHQNTEDDQVIIIISTSSTSNLEFVLNLVLEENFVVGINDSRSLTVSPSEPRFYQFSWGKETLPKPVILRVHSPDEICMVVSIQNISCPVFDLERTVQFEGYRQTVNKLGGITITHELYPKGFYIVFVVKGNDYDCTEKMSTNLTDRTKQVDFSFNPSIGYEDYMVATVAALFLYLSFYVMALFVSFVYFLKKRNNPDFINDVVPTIQGDCAIATVSGACSISDMDSVAATSTYSTSIHQSNTYPSQSGNGASSDSSADDDSDYDHLYDAPYNKDVIRSKKFLSVADLSRKSTKILRKKSLLYFWNLLTVATFYALPVIQLVVSSQKVLRQTGNQDLCYYNFLCSYPLGLLSDFNHVFSNIGYVLLGLLFVILVHRRDRLHSNDVAVRTDLDKLYGIPQHYGLLYAMGAALVMEGILSGCYHVCPNRSNFQFDTSFMYVIALLCMLKIYHTRHPDINASAYATFGVLALVILVGVAGILSGTRYFWAGFTVLHLLTCLWLSGKIYYMGRLRFGFGIFHRTWNLFWYEIVPNPCEFFKPKYPSRLVLLILGNAANWALAGVVWVYHLDNSFGSYLLAIFMANLMLYTVFYIVMKCICKETLKFQPLAYLVLATVGWIVSLNFFLRKSTSWMVSPANSRAFNQPCEILNFYDKHDIWHFLSAFSMFFSFMTLLTLDDDLVHVPRSNICVF